MVPDIQISQAALLARQGAFGEALAAELGARLGRTFEFAHAPLQNLGVLELAETDDPIVHQKFRFTESDGLLHVVMPKRDAALVAALERRVEGDALSAARDAEFDAESTSALAQVMESVIDVLRRSFDTANVPPLAVDEAVVVATPQSEPTWIDDAFYVRMRYAMTVEGFDEGRLDFVFSQSHLIADVARGQSVCFVTLGDGDRKKIAEVEVALGWPVVTVEPRELAKALDERVLEATVLVVPLDLCGRSGLELAESLSRNPRLEKLSILIGATRRTRVLLLAALRAGARTLVAHPYDVEELRSVARPPAEEAQA
jgi:CheY-like chemotaxis protein